MLGDPKYTIAVPCWVTGQPIADPLEDRSGGELGEIARTLRDWSLTRDPNAIDTSILPGIWKDLWQLEDKTMQQVTAMRSAGKSQVLMRLRPNHFISKLPRTPCAPCKAN